MVLISGKGTISVLFCFVPLGAFLGLHWNPLESLLSSPGTVIPTQQRETGCLDRDVLAQVTESAAIIFTTVPSSVEQFALLSVQD